MHYAHQAEMLFGLVVWDSPRGLPTKNPLHVRTQVYGSMGILQVRAVKHYFWEDPSVRSRKEGAGVSPLLSADQDGARGSLCFYFSGAARCIQPRH